MKKPKTLFDGVKEHQRTLGDMQREYESRSGPVSSEDFARLCHSVKFLLLVAQSTLRERPPDN
jgi:hypothetical protein